MDTTLATTPDTTYRLQRDYVCVLLRLEGAATALAALGLYIHLQGGWALFLALFLLPDASFAFYLLGTRIGALGYNAAHSTLGALTLAAVGIATHAPTAILIGLIWLAHIGMDRALGYGLKYARGFGFTHLGPIGRQKQE